MWRETMTINKDSLLFKLTYGLTENDLINHLTVNKDIAYTINDLRMHFKCGNTSLLTLLNSCVRKKIVIKIKTKRTRAVYWMLYNQEVLDAIKELEGK